MSPAPFARLATDAEFRGAVQKVPMHTLGSLVLSPLQERLLGLAACRLQEGTRPPRCYYWWHRSLPTLSNGRVI